MMALDTINLYVVAKDEGSATYENVWEASALDQSIDTPHFFLVGLFLEAIIRRKEKAVELLETLCGNVSTDWVWAEESIESKNLLLADIEAQDVSRFS